MRAVHGVSAAFFQASLTRHVRAGHVIQRQVLALPIRRLRAVAAGAQHARHGAELRQVLGVVPLVELGLGRRIDVHRRDQQRTGAAGAARSPGSSCSPVKRRMRFAIAVTRLVQTEAFS